MPWFNRLEAGPSLHMTYMDILLAFTTLKILLRWEPDLIHAHLHEGGFIGEFCSKFRRTPVILDAQGSLTGEMLMHGFLSEGSVSHKFFEMLERMIVHHADAILTSSPELAACLKDKFDLDRERIFELHDAVDVNRFRPELRQTRCRAKLREKLGIRSDSKVVVYLGGLGAGKGIDILLTAIDIIVREQSINSIMFLIMGYPGEAYYRKKAGTMGLTPWVRFTGRIPYDKAPQWLAIGDLAVAPKLFRFCEANGKIYTYMGMGLPVVTFDHPTNRRVLGNLGVYAKYGEPESLAEEIVRVANNDQLSTMLSQKLREKAIKYYTWDKVAQKLMDIYAKIISEFTR
jgi:glycosyltransferase involved in cell wall biosynthesis